MCIVICVCWLGIVWSKDCVVFICVELFGSRYGFGNMYVLIDDMGIYFFFYVVMFVILVLVVVGIVLFMLMVMLLIMLG